MGTHRRRTLDSSMTRAFDSELWDRIASGNRAGAVALAHAAVEEGTTSIEALHGILSRGLVALGGSWQAGDVEVWREHLATSITRTIVESSVALVAAAAPEPSGHTVILAAPSNEQHDLGLRMLADRFTLAGWTAHFLGADLPVDQLIDAVEHLGADAVALSAATHFHRVALRGYVDTVATAHPDLTVWVGGPAFAAGHDGWADHEVLDPRVIPTSPRARRP